LHHFEKIVSSIVAQLPGGFSDWALPYWNYSTSATTALLPVPFRSSILPSGGPNNLYIPQRTPNANAGNGFLDSGDTNVDCLKAKPFANTFGGPITLNHPPGTPGALEQTPHNTVHGQLGGATGFMGGFSTAPLDPMFWLHHCNIDRLWEVWVQRQKHLGNLDRNPKVAGAADKGGWLDQPFDFHDSTGAAVRMTSRQVLNTRVPPLSYEYEDTSDPFKENP
jgi:tyrosinase